MLLPGSRPIVLLAAILATGGAPLCAQSGGDDRLADLLAERRFEDALPLLQEREEEWNTAVRKDDSLKHRLYWAQSLSLLGFVEDHLNMPEPALKHLRLARDLLIEADAEPASLADALDKLGRAEHNAGHYETAEQSFLAAVEQIRRLPDLEQQPRLSETRDHLALLYLEMARYDEAGRIFHESLATSGDDGKVLAQRHGYLGKYYHAMRSYAAACDHFERALDYATEEWGTDHPNVIFLTGQLGLAWMRLGSGGDDEALEQARRNLSKAAKLARQQPPTHQTNLELASYMTNLGILARHEGQLEKARDIFTDSLQMLVPRVGASSPVLAPFFNNLGLACQQLGRHQEAADAYREAATRYRDSVGTEHHRYIETNSNIVLNALLADGPGEQIARTVEETTRSRLAVFERVIDFGSERERLNYLQRDNIASLPCTLGHDPAFLANLLLRTKGRLLDSLIAADESEASELLTQLRSKQRRLDDLLFRFEDREKLAALRDEINALLAELGRDPARTDNVARTAPDCTAVQASLPENGAFVDLVRYQNHLAAPHGPLWYGAVLILPEGEPQWIPLAAETDLDAWLGILKDRLDYRAQLLSSRSSVSPPALRLRAALRQLHDLFWAPVAKHLPDRTETIALSPDGKLNFLSFAVLMDENDRFLASKYRNLVYTTSGRDLLADDERAAFGEGLWALVAVPEFEAGLSSADALPPSALDQRILETIESFPAVPGAREELRRLRRLIPDEARALELVNASEPQLRGLEAGPSVLHLATHAFFLPSGSSGQADGMQDFDRQPDQFYRSGLVLTEAKRALDQRSTGVDVPFEQDGVIFAHELASLPLENTRLVTLSSCESGLGKSVSGQGVLGLRSGFMRAGTQNILISLWPVSDNSTPMFMEEVYRLALATDQIGQSLWEAQRRNLARVDPKDDAALEEAVLRYGCFVLAQRGPLEATVPMPEHKPKINYYWAILLAFGVLGLAVLLIRRPPFRRPER